MDFNELIALNTTLLIEKLDLGDLASSAIELFLPLFEDKITSTLNELINSNLPEISMQTIINLIPDALIKGLVPSNFDKTILDKATITIEKAQFVFQFKKYGENQEWKNQSGNISNRILNNNDTFRLHVQNVQIKISLVSEENGEFRYLTKEDIAFNVVFSSKDANENL
ncbi:hypothetical protein [Spiroplasma taiwanense]|uniref:Uncharacterized protein n=1 Tax=Spiroplasma taiwanense CT-1 TaxID=1276220 RepID=S5LXS9_9MOLU|nr:hypothetical protein [Spiroplasma taiwanense]AGR41401.1 hypothetical protein STAIW_v1c08130 [Spiroplasma taiwanense CT-1]